MNLDNILKMVAIIFLTPFALIAGWVALILLTTVFTVSVHIIFWLGGVFAVVAAFALILTLLVEKYDKTRQTGRSGTD